MYRRPMPSENLENVMVRVSRLERYHLYLEERTLPLLTLHQYGDVLARTMTALERAGLRTMLHFRDLMTEESGFEGVKLDEIKGIGVVGREELYIAWENYQKHEFDFLEVVP